MKIAITKQQQNALLMFAVLVLSITVLFLFIYAPKSAKLKKLRNELAMIEASLNKIHAIIGEKEDLGKGILRMRQEAGVCEAKFIKPREISALLQELAQEARSQDLEVVSMQPSEFFLSYGDKGNTLSVDDQECNTINIEMNLVGSYRSLIEYMSILETRPTQHLFINRFNIERQATSDKLKVHITVCSFALLNKKPQRQ